MKRAPSFTFRAVLEKSGNRLWGSHVHVPAPVARKLVAGGSRRVVRTLNGLEEHQCALLLHGGGTFVLSVNRTWLKKLGVSPGERVTVTLRPDADRYGLPLTEELREILRQDREGDRLFHALTPGRRRTLLHIAGLTKRPEARAWRAGVIVRHLKANAGSIQYRWLALELRRPGHAGGRNNIP
jgi:hypothetical protein